MLCEFVGTYQCYWRNILCPASRLQYVPLKWWYLLPVHTALQPRRQTSTSSPLREHHTSFATFILHAANAASNKNLVLWMTLVTFWLLPPIGLAIEEWEIIIMGTQQANTRVCVQTTLNSVISGKYCHRDFICSHVRACKGYMWVCDCACTWIAEKFVWNKISRGRKNYSVLQTFS
jgi:hypothetical protein